MSSRESTKSGFTLIELTLAIAFISVLLVTISLITQEIVKLYRKGYTIKTVNQVGRDVIEDLTNSVIGSTLKTNVMCNNFTSHQDDCKSDNARKTMYHQFYSRAPITIRSPGATAVTTRVPLYGVFCSGKYSYVWNTGYLYGDSYYAPDGTKLKGIAPSPGGVNSDYAKLTINGRPYHLAKIEDSQNRICMSLLNSNDYDTDPQLPTNHNLDLTDGSIFPTSAIPEEVTELISDSDTDLAIYDLVVFPPAKVTTTGRLFVAGSFVLGTIEGGVNIMSNGNYCQVPDDLGYSSFDLSYCAINKFNFSVSTTGTGL